MHLSNSLTRKILLSIVMLSAVMSSFGQDTITFHYDASSRSLQKPAGPNPFSLRGNLSYTFRVEGINDAYFDLNFAVQKLKKDFTVPDLLKGIIPYNPTAVGPFAAHKDIRATSTLYDETSFYRIIQSEYAALRSFVLASEEAVHWLNVHHDSILSCRQHATQAIIQAGSILHAGSGTPDGEIIKRTLDSTIVDVENRVQLLKDNSLLTDNDAGIAMYDMAEFLKKNERQIKLLADILEAYRKCKDHIDSKPYKAAHIDYLTIGVNIYANRFAGVKDTVLSEKLEFYRTGYLDLGVTSGFFYTNLASPSYYFTGAQGQYAKESRSTADLSVGALVHVNYVAMPGIRFGLCAGGAISLLDARTKLLAGPSLSIGRKSIFALSGGLAYSALPRPSHLLNSGYTGAIITPVPTYTKIITGFFLGLSYTLVKL